MVFYTYKGKVSKIVDADTVDITVDLGFEVYKRVRCRLAGINAPELSTPEGKSAKTYLIGILPLEAQVSIVSKEYDKYGRSVAEIYYGDIHINNILVTSGHAVIYKG